MRKYVYVAGPYTNIDPVINTRNAILAGEELIEAGFIPYIPHLSLFWHLVAPHPYLFWMQFDTYWLLKCDAVLRLPGDSSGAELEVRVAKENNIPVFYTLDDLKNALND